MSLEEDNNVQMVWMYYGSADWFTVAAPGGEYRNIEKVYIESDPLPSMKLKDITFSVNAGTKLEHFLSGGAFIKIKLVDKDNKVVPESDFFLKNITGVDGFWEFKNIFETNNPKTELFTKKAWTGDLKDKKVVVYMIAKINNTADIRVQGMRLALLRQQDETGDIPPWATANPGTTSSATSTSSATTTSAATSGAGQTSKPVLRNDMGKSTTAAPTSQMYVIAGSILTGLVFIFIVVYLYYRYKTKATDNKKKGK